MFIREDRKTVIFTRKLDLSLEIKKQTRFCQNLSYNFNLLSIPRVKRSYHRLKQTLDLGKSVTFPYSSIGHGGTSTLYNFMALLAL